MRRLQELIGLFENCALYFNVEVILSNPASGDGDKIMCYCPSFQIVQLMRQVCNKYVKKLNKY